jgi:2'-5' RNA ligase
MRLFVAIDLTDEARRQIADVQQRLVARIGGSGLKLVRSEHLHLTLAFIGEVDEERGRKIVGSMEVPFDQRPFEIEFGGVGVFPPDGRPRILWLGVTHGAMSSVRLQEAVATRLEPFGMEREERPFSPHLTLARWREGRRSDARRLLADEVGVVARMPVHAVTLFQSRLSGSGPTYSVLAQASLATADAGRVYKGHESPC